VVRGVKGESFFFLGGGGGGGDPIEYGEGF